MINLEARDGHTFNAYRARPDGDVRAGLVVIQEIFGVNSHIRNVADRFAAVGFDALAPALFDRAERGLELGYQPDDIDRGRAVRGQLSNDQALLDVDAAVRFLAQTGRPVAVVGYCWGGSLAWAAANRLQGLAGAIEETHAPSPVLGTGLFGMRSTATAGINAPMTTSASKRMDAMN